MQQHYALHVVYQDKDIDRPIYYSLTGTHKLTTYVPAATISITVYLNMISNKTHPKILKRD